MTRQFIYKLMYSVLCYFSQPQERAPIQVSPAPEEPAGASGGSEPNNAESEDLEVRGSRFSKSAEERQRMLLQRKEELLQRARRSAILTLFLQCS